MHICQILDAWDRAIRQTTDLIAAKRRFKQGLIQQLLTGKRRFEGFTQQWGNRQFGKFLTESRIPGTNGNTARKLTVRLYGKGVYPKSDGRPGSNATRFYKRRAGQFIYSKLDFLNGAFGIVPPELDGHETTLDVPAFDVSDSVDSRWLLYFVTRPSFYRNQLGLAHGGRKARRVNPSDLLKLSLDMPEKHEQSRIADALELLDRQIELLGKQLDATKKQKQGLMRKLLTGEVRVRVTP
jgi:type I restriction enzyme S subunit